MQDGLANNERWRVDGLLYRNALDGGLVGAAPVVPGLVVLLALVNLRLDNAKPLAFQGDNVTIGQPDPGIGQAELPIPTLLFNANLVIDYRAALGIVCPHDDLGLHLGFCG